MNLSHKNLYVQSALLVSGQYNHDTIHLMNEPSTTFNTYMDDVHRVPPATAAANAPHTDTNYTHLRSVLTDIHPPPTEAVWSAENTQKLWRRYSKRRGRVCNTGAGASASGSHTNRCNGDTVGTSPPTETPHPESDNRFDNRQPCRNMFHECQKPFIRRFKIYMIQMLQLVLRL
uniref:Uncharacterized protein n=2 Tax=Lygus hesperus TaxID=30085 RepID=A0A146L9N8_LYGHE